MPALFVFLLKVNVALIVFCLGYYLVLRKLTFYTLNRVYLLGAIIFSSVYPLINLSGFMLRHQAIASPVQRVAINWQAQQQFIEQPAYWDWITTLFWLGTFVFAGRLLLQLLSLLKLYRNSKSALLQNHRVRITQASISPFSFWQNIYINPDNIEVANLPSILQHEQVHVKQWHTLDILLAEISAIFYWFNPGIWLIKKAVRENIEFITDRKILQTGADSKTYQYSLLHVSIAATASAGITNHFNFSTLKKRIKMMNAKKSSNLNLTRYAVLVPCVVALLLVFGFSKAELINRKSNQLTNLITTSVKKQLDLAPESNLQTTPVQTIRKTKTVITDTSISKKSDTELLANFSPKDFLKQVGQSADNVKNMIINYDLPDTAKTYTINSVKVTQDEFIAFTSNDTNKTKFKAVTIKPIKVDGINIYVTKTPPKDTTITFSKVITGKPYAIVPKSTTNLVRYSYTISDKNQTTEMTDKVYVIDGKEATEKQMKKLSAGDIEKITVKDGAQMVKEYGEKAKNGVIFITTKKSN